MLAFAALTSLCYLCAPDSTCQVGIARAVGTLTKCNDNLRSHTHTHKCHSHSRVRSVQFRAYLPLDSLDFTFARLFRLLPLPVLLARH